MKGSDTDSRTIDVAAGLIFREGRLLIAQRPPGTHLAGLWEFPGGKLESGESFEDCLRRELREELGVEVEVGDLVEEITHSYTEKTVRLKFFRCRCSDNPQPITVHALAWIQSTELDRYQFPAADARLLERLRSSSALWKA